MAGTAWAALEPHEVSGRFDLHLCLFACQVIADDYHRERSSAEPSEAIICVLACRYRRSLEHARALLAEAGYHDEIPEPGWVTDTLTS
jgi:hypothetical protein